jgi:hypothetical protein
MRMCRGSALFDPRLPCRSPGDALKLVARQVDRELDETCEAVQDE